MTLQHISGLINLSLPVILMYQVYPSLFNTYWGMFIYAIMIGIITYYINKRATNAMIQALTYSPSGEHKQQLEEMISLCGMNPQEISLKYAYTNEQIVLTAFNAIILDPISWSYIQTDPEAIKVIAIFEQYTAPTLSEMQKKRLAAIKDIFSPEVQGFFFKRQLAHIYHYYSTKKLLVIGFVGTLAAYIGILAGMSVLHISGILALSLGILVGGLFDILLTYLSNALFKLPEEKAADLFAAQYSSTQEIEATALFFEQYQHLKDTFKDQTNVILSYIPSIFTTGHLDPVTRAHYIRSLAVKK
jgi:hypothetical protein